MDRELKVVINLDDNASGKLKNLSSNVSSAGKGFSNLSSIGSVASKTLSGIGNVLVDVSKQALTTASVGIAGLGAGLGFLGNKALDVAGDLQQAERAYETLLGSATDAQKAIDQIKIDAAKTPFDMRELIRANQLLISTGISVGESRQAVLDLGNAIVATGGGEEQFNRLMVNLQQIKNLGKATELDMRQFAFSGINMYKLLAESTGKSTAELRDMDITYEMVSQALRTAAAEGGLFENALEKQSGSWNLLKSNLRDVFNIMLSDIVTGTGLFGYLNDKLAQFVDYLVANKEEIIAFFKGIGDNIKEFVQSEGFQNFIERLKDLGKWIIENKDIVINFIQGFAIALGLLAVVGILTNPFTQFIAVVTLLGAVIGAVKTLWDKNMWGIRDTTNEVITKLTKWYKDHEVELKIIFETIKTYLIVWFEWLKLAFSATFIAVKAIVQAGWAVIKASFQFFVDVLQGIIKIFTGIFTGDWNKVWEGVKQITTAGSKFIATIFNSFSKIGEEALRALFNVFNNWFGKVWKTAQDYAEKIRRAISNAFDKDKKNSPSIMDKINDTVKSVNLKMTEFKSPEPLAHSPMFSQMGNTTNNRNITVTFTGPIGMGGQGDIQSIINAVKMAINQEDALFAQGVY